MLCLQHFCHIQKMKLLSFGRVDHNYFTRVLVNSNNMLICGRKYQTFFHNDFAICLFCHPIGYYKKKPLLFSQLTIKIDPLLISSSCLLFLFIIKNATN